MTKPTAFARLAIQDPMVVRALNVSRGRTSCTMEMPTALAARRMPTRLRAVLQLRPVNATQDPQAQTVVDAPSVSQASTRSRWGMLCAPTVYKVNIQR